MRVFVTGDTHGNALNDFEKILKWDSSKNLTKNDILIILGDFGFIWNNIQSDSKEITWFNYFDKLSYTLCFLDGNHENFDRINKLPEIDFYGGKAGKASENVYHLKRGQIYTFEDKTFFTLGGADSIDKAQRIIGIDWWHQELLSKAEEDFALDNLLSVNNKVDYILTHTLPKSKILEMIERTHINFFCFKCEDPVANFLDYIYKSTKFKHWYCGHLHEDYYLENFSILYHKILQII